MRSSKRLAWWGAYVLGSAAVVAGLAWTTVRVRSLEREEARAKRESDRQETLRLALWRMDSWLAALLAREASRAWYEYEPYYPQTIAFNRLLEPIAEGEVLLPSPLLSFESEWLPLHFQWRPETGFTSPQVPGEMSSAMIACGPIEPSPECAIRLAAIASRIDGAAILARLAVAEKDLFADANGPALESRPPQQVEQSWASGGQLARALDPDDFKARAATSNYAQQAFNEENRTKQVRTIVEPELALKSEPPLMQRQPMPRIGPLTALVVGADELLVARRVDLGDRVLVQGAVVDWRNLRESLLEQVADLVPGAALEPCEASADTLRLASLPVRLLPPPEPPLERVPHPATPGLALVWIAALGAIAATGLALRASIGAAVRTSRFASSVTHELRTPLTTFRLYSEMLAEGMVTDPARARQYVATLRDESARLGLLVENVLAWSRAENGRAPAEPRPILLADLHAEVAPILERRVEESGGVFETSVEAPSDALLKTDPARVRQILFNLVDNACKYAGPEPAVRLTVAARGDRIVFAVEDRGPGVPAALRRRIFRAFDRGQRGPGDAVRGLGLGLAISTELARSLSARLRYESGADDRGARFELEVPAAAGG